MSIRMIDRVWRCGLYSSGTLLVLLAMADWADDEGGRIFPKVHQVAVKARLTDRQVRSCIRQLETDGILELVAAATGKPGQPNEYRLIAEKLQSIEGGKTKATTDGAEGGKDFTPEIYDTEGGNLQQEGGNLRQGGRKSEAPYIDEPSSKPSLQPSSEPSPGELVISAPSEIDQAIAAFNVAASRCPKWAKSHGGEKHKKLVAARLKEVGLGGFLAVVDAAARSAHLGGPIPTSGDHVGWRIDLEWFASKPSFERIRGGRYAPAPPRRLVGRESARAGLMEFMAAGGDDE